MPTINVLGASLPLLSLLARTLIPLDLFQAPFSHATKSLSHFRMMMSTARHTEIKTPAMLMISALGANLLLSNLLVNLLPLPRPFLQLFLPVIKFLRMPFSLTEIHA